MFPGEQIKRTIIYDMLLIFIIFLHQIKRFFYPYPSLKKLRVHSQGNTFWHFIEYAHRGESSGCYLRGGGGGQSPGGKWF